MNKWNAVQCKVRSIEVIILLSKNSTKFWNGSWSVKRRGGGESYLLMVANSLYSFLSVHPPGMALRVKQYNYQEIIGKFTRKSNSIS